MIGRPILYRTSKDFLMRFGLGDLDELPSLKEFEALAREALGADDGIAEASEAEASEQAAPEPASESASEPRGAGTDVAGEAPSQPADRAAKQAAPGGSDLRAR